MGSIFWLASFLLLVQPLAAASLPGGIPLTEDFSRSILEEALDKAGVEEPFDVVIEAPKLPLGNQAKDATEVVVTDLQHDPSTARFHAVLNGTINGTPRFQIPVHGRVEAWLQLPVLAQALAAGETIGADDLDFVMLRADRVPAKGLVEPDQLIGAETRRRLPSRRVLTENDVGPPRMVRKGRPVRLLYAKGQLVLTALGTAREDGSLHEPVRAMNVTTRQMVEGIATGPDEITVGIAAAAGTGS